MGATAKFKPLKLNWRMPFGKYKGDPIREIIDKDSGYFSWLLTTDVKFDDEVLDYYKLPLDKRKDYDKKVAKEAISRAVILSNWQVIKVKPEDRNFDLKPEDFDPIPEIEEEEKRIYEGVSMFSF